ncbi:hypothetical protein PMI32_00593 [Pseudomonas sp. GM60]|nr:hypothetical protein PMI32_00593 [Pseudomonas sp. GM60]
MLAIAASNFAPPLRPPSLASQAPTGPVPPRRSRNHANLCRSRLAGDSGPEFCAALQIAFAGKPGSHRSGVAPQIENYPTSPVGDGLLAIAASNFAPPLRPPSLASQAPTGPVPPRRSRNHANLCRSKLAGESDLKLSATLQAAIAGKPGSHRSGVAPQIENYPTSPVGASLLAISPNAFSSEIR